MDVPAVITEPPRQPKSIESLKGLLDRLGSPDLTLPEAKRLRTQLNLLLAGVDPVGEG